MSAEAAGAALLETERLRMRRLHLDDAPFIVELLNDEAFLRYIGDKGVRSVADAHIYLTNGPIASYQKNGFGLWMVERKADGAALGMCGLVRRAGLDDPDLGFAQLPAFRGQGYVVEAAAAVVAWARDTLRLPRLVAIATPDNAASIAVLERVGLAFARRLRLAEDGDELALYAAEWDQPSRSSSWSGQTEA